MTERSLSRRSLLLGSAAAGLGLAGLGGPAAAQPPFRRSATDAVNTLFGAYCGPAKYPNVNPVETKEHMQARVESALGGGLGVERIYNEHSWKVPRAGIPAIISFSQDPSAVAAGRFDSQIRQFAQSLDRNTTYWLCLNHEPDVAGKPYTPAQQVAGFKQFSRVVRSVAGPNTKLTTILMSWTLRQGVDTWRQWYPGPGYVDALGWDAYFRPNLHRTADTVYGLAKSVSQAEGKQFLICETSMGTAHQGGGGFTDQEWTTLVASAIAYLDGAAAAVAWFYTYNANGNWKLDGHAGALAEWRQAVTMSRGKREWAYDPAGDR